MTYQTKDIPGFPGYRIDTNGDVWSNRIDKGLRNKPIKLKPQKGSRWKVSLCKDGKVYNRKIHLLVILTFKGPRPEGLVVCHNDGNPSNNCLANLRWDTYKANTHDMIEHGTILRGEKNHRAKLTAKDVILMRSLRQDSNLTFKRIGEIFGVIEVTAQAAINRRTWKHIN